MNNLLNVEQVAERLNMSPRNVRELVYKRKIEHVKCGRLLRFKPETIDAYIAINTMKPEGK